MSAEKFEVRDIVRISNGSRIIITGFNPTRPANKYRGVLENGHGKEYIFGDKHRPVWVGVAPIDHRALVAIELKASRVETETAKAGVSIMNSTTKVIIGNLVASAEAVLSKLEAEGRDTGVGGPISDLRDAIIAARVGNLLA